MNPHAQPGGLAGVEANDLNHIEEPVKGKTQRHRFIDALKKKASNFWSKHKGTILGVLEGAAASLLLAPNPESTP